MAMNDSLYAAVVRRLRAAGTIFGDRIKLSLRQDVDEQDSALALPYAIVVPGDERAPALAAGDDMQTIVIPRLINVVGQFDACDSDNEHAAAGDIELARLQLVQVLVNWHPRDRGFAATLYDGFKLNGTRQPHVAVTYSFVAYEEIGVMNEPACDEECPEPPPREVPLTVSFYVEPQCPPDPCPAGATP